MESVGCSEVYDDVVYDDRQRSIKSASSIDTDSHQNGGDRPHSNRSHRRHSRHSSRLSVSIADEESRLPTPTPSCMPDTTAKRDSLVPLSTRETLSSAASLSTVSHRRQTVGGKLGFITFEDILADVISLCPQMTSWLNDSLDNVVCVDFDLESSKERALPAFYYANTSLQATGAATAAVRGAKTSRPSTVSTSVDPDNINKRDNFDGSCAASPRPTTSGRRRTRNKQSMLPADDDYRCFARSPSSLRVIYEPDF